MRKEERIRHEGYNPIIDSYIPFIDDRGKPKAPKTVMRVCKECGKKKPLLKSFYRRHRNYYFWVCKICVSQDYRNKKK